MDNLLDTIRNAVRAVIIKDNKLLVLEKTDGSYSLPGGAPNVDETLQQGLLRECQEEIGCQIKIDKLAYVGDYFKVRGSTPLSIRHQIEFLFLCTVADDYRPQSGHHPDKRQVDVLWLELENFEQQPFVPTGMIEPIKKLQSSGGDGLPDTVYLGTI